MVPKLGIAQVLKKRGVDAQAALSNVQLLVFLKPCDMREIMTMLHVVLEKLGVIVEGIGTVRMYSTEYCP